MFLNLHCLWKRLLKKFILQSLFHHQASRMLIRFCLLPLLRFHLPHPSLGDFLYLLTALHRHPLLHHLHCQDNFLNVLLLCRRHHQILAVEPRHHLHLHLHLLQFVGHLYRLKSLFLQSHHHHHLLLLQCMGLHLLAVQGRHRHHLHHCHLLAVQGRCHHLHFVEHHLHH